MLFDKDFTTNPPASNLEFNKTWVSLGNGKEVMKNQLSEKKATTDSNTIITNKKRTIEAGDFIYYENQWIPITNIKDNKATIKFNDKLIELINYRKEVYIRVLFCTLSFVYIHVIPVRGNDTLEYISKKLIKKFNPKDSKHNWYYQGKVCNKESTIEQIKVKEDEKLMCIGLGYDIRTFKRFRQLDGGRGWYLSRSSGDAISFISSQAIDLFGFGMYYVREGPKTYTLKYELLINEEVKKSETVILTNPDEIAQIAQIYFNPENEAISVDANMKITISIKYLEFEDSSRLFVGSLGEGYNSFEGNEQGLFTVEETSLSGNGTDMHAGQIPELYYSRRN